MIKILSFSLIVTFVSCNLVENSGTQNQSSKTKGTEVFYTCSMHPQIKEKGPGKCPICHMQLTKIELEHGSPNEVVKEIYYCKSDESVTSKAPGECPLDGTPLVKKGKTKEIVAKVQLRKSQIHHFKADTFKVTSMKMKKKIRLLGTVLKSEERESNIPARVAGRVEEVLVQSTGALIKEGDPILKLYSSKLLTGGDEYLIARKNYLSNKSNKEFKDLFEQSTQRMKLWGIRDFQLKNWAREKKIPREIIIYAPVTGIVEKKNAIAGKYFKEGQSFFDLVDLNSLWIEMDVYEHDSALVKLGQKVELEFGAYPGERWIGEVDFINPVLNEKTRTLKIRSTLKNEKGKLRPGMAAVASVTLELDKEPLVIPRSAIIDTGKRKVVWLDIGEDHYQAKNISTGFESEGYLEVKNGLSEGDNVVIEGNFLLDASAQLFGGYENDSTNPSDQH